MSKSTIEINWDNTFVGVSLPLFDYSAAIDKEIEISYSQMVAELAARYAYVLVRLPPEELRKRYFAMLNGL